MAEVVANYLRDFDPKSERCWIAEKDGGVIGSVFIVREDETTARLRMLYIDASARGLGIGARLVEECLRFARQIGYKNITLWTTSNLTAARKIYQKAGGSQRPFPEGSQVHCSDTAMYFHRPHNLLLQRAIAACILAHAKQAIAMAYSGWNAKKWTFHKVVT